MKNNLALVRSEEPNSLSIVERVVDAIDDVKGKDITVIDVRQVFGESDYFIIASGRSDRQVQGLANRILEDLDSLGVHPVSIEGLDDGQWVLIDCGEVIVHLFYEPVRSYYDLESLWIRGKKIEVGAATASSISHQASQ